MLLLQKDGYPVFLRYPSSFLLPLPDQRVHPASLLYLPRVHRLLLLPEVLASVLETIKQGSAIIDNIL